jgi:hypothetical protein
MEPEQLSLEERVLRLEGKLGWRQLSYTLKPQLFPWSLLLLAAAFFCGYAGLGLPNHYYQIVLAMLFVALFYHRGWMARPVKAVHWLLAVMNTLVLSLLFKLLIGGGHRFPFSWLYYPNIQRNVAEGDKGWIPSMPDVSIAWEPSTIAQWSIDLTIVQTFLLLVTLIGALIDFQPFISFTAFLLVVVSIPALVSFDWPWVFPAIIAAVVGLYLQSAEANQE